ncbi:hypothetical protein CMQ_4197 [Grosmannia clavigera kw1407]|uniref:Amidoligase enzyme n=1 Tax=Grosmannia clavigera (strain kw1407 / UAMH 11150) TaxID=655863 RepID=F0X821_GROCL|nr:uncharacterized protein CMQ_4197 [Grosmannia clavigera kw1407]EFX06128.1 hypothetical protein CMQ_4197 [Grosmannia clavigera kw1407]
MNKWLTAVKWSPRDGRSDNYHRAKTHEVLHEILLSESIDAAVPEGDEEERGFQKWLIEGDGSLRSGEGDGYCVFSIKPSLWTLTDGMLKVGVESISPILFPKKDWRYDLCHLYEIISSKFEIKVGACCGTHVHISPDTTPGRRWTLDELKSIVKTIAYFNVGVVDMLPPERKQNRYAVPNFCHRDSPHNVRGLHATACSTGDYGPLFSHIDQVVSPGAFAHYFPNRWWEFNFSNITDDSSSCGTIEFRSAPGSEKVDTAIHWALWLMSFAASAPFDNFSCKGKPGFLPILVKEA